MAKRTKRKVGFLNSATSTELAVPVAAFLRGMKQAGLEKKDVEVTYKFAKHRLGDLPDLAKRLVKADVEVLAATGGIASAEAAVAAVQAANMPIRIVYISGDDPAANRMLASSGNTTGVNTATTEHLPERLERARELLGSNKQIVILVRPNTKVGNLELSELKKLDKSFSTVAADSDDQLEARFREAKNKGQALLVSSDPFFTSRRKKIVRLAKENKVPAIYAWREYVDAGGLMSFGSNLSNAYRQAGVYVGQILGDASYQPAALKQSNYELAINVKAAAALDIKVSRELLARADYVLD